MGRYVVPLVHTLSVHILKEGRVHKREVGKRNQMDATEVGLHILDSEHNLVEQDIHSHKEQEHIQSVGLLRLHEELHNPKVDKCYKI